MAKSTKKLTLEMGDKFDELLTAQAADAETSKAELVRRAVATYAFLRAESDENGAIGIRGRDGVQKQLVLR